MGPGLFSPDDNLGNIALATGPLLQWGRACSARMTRRTVRSRSRYEAGFNGAGLVQPG